MQSVADNIDNLPPPIRDLLRYVVWRKEPRYIGQAPTKMPYDPNTQRRAKSNDPKTWASLPVALQVLAQSAGRFLGIGFVLHDDAPFFGVDLDDCRDPNSGVIVPRARDIIAQFNTYTEISVSLCGAKMIGAGEMPTPDGRGKNYRRDPWKTGAGGIEFYRRGRFFALTGNRLDGTPAEIEPGTDQLAKLYRELYPPSPPRPRRGGMSMADGTGAKRCAAYMAALPPSISGEGGHDRLLHAACVTLRFGLADTDALNLLHTYNARAVPQWDDRDIERKLSEAHKLIGADFGCMLADRPSFRSQVRHPRWRINTTIGGAA